MARSECGLFQRALASLADSACADWPGRRSFPAPSSAPLPLSSCSTRLRSQHHPRPTDRPLRLRSVSINSINASQLHLKFGSNAFVRSSPESNQLTAAFGDNVSLPCDFNVTGSDQVTLLLFYRNASHVGQVGAPLYTLDARNAGPAQHFVGPDLGSKIRLQWPPNQLVSIKHSLRRYSAALWIRNLSLQDAGEYLCRVDFRWARTLVNYIRLDVIGSLFCR